MEIAWFRDLVICILGLVVVIVFILFAILSYVIYRKIRPILDSAGSISTSAKGIVSDVRESIDTVKEEAMSPLIQLVAVIQGVRQGIDVFNKFFKKDQGGSDDQ